jgi:tRNA A37 threonylcarbamoyladenosine dehydratase
MDMDTVSLTNLNRQAVALHSTLGQPKADVMRARILDINPEAEVLSLVSRYDPNAPPALWDEPLDLAIDAVDDVPAKVDIAWQAQKRGIRCISCMGAGNKLDPGRFEAADLYDTSVCPLCRSMRKRARERGIERLRVVYSREEPIKTGQSAPGSLVTVTATAGLRLAAEAVRMLLEQP